MSESMEQILFINWMRKTHKEHRIFHIPNGGQRNKATAGKLKAEGVSAGVPDLFVPSLRLFIEMKDAKGVVSPAQKDWLEYLAGVGYSVAVCRSFEDAKLLILEFVQLNVKNIKK